MCNGKVSDIPIIGPLISKPARMLPMLGSAIGTTMGVGPTMTNLISAGIGAGQGGTTGLWGEPGGGSMFKGGAAGFLQGPVGRGISTGLSSQRLNWANPGATNSSGAPAFANFGQGFMQGAGEAVPFKNQINNLLGRQFFGTETGASDWISNNGVINVPGTVRPESAGDITGAAGKMGTTQGKSSGLMNYLPSALALLGAQSMKTPEYDVPSAESVYQGYRGRADELTGPITEQGRTAAAKILEYAKDPTAVAGPAVDNYFNAINQEANWAMDTMLADVDARYQASGTYGGSDWQRDRNNAIAKVTNNANLQKGQIQQQVFQQQLTTHVAAIADAYAMDQAALEQLVGLTQMSIYEASVKYGIKAQEVADLRKAMYELAAASFPGTSDYGKIASPITQGA